MQLTHTFFFSFFQGTSSPIAHRYTCHCTIFIIISLIISAIILISEHLHIVVSKLTSFVVAKGWMKVYNQTMNEFFQQFSVFPIRIEYDHRSHKRNVFSVWNPFDSKKTIADSNSESISSSKKATLRTLGMIYSVFFHREKHLGFCDDRFYSEKNRLIRLL